MKSTAKALFGTLFLAACGKANHGNVPDQWTPDMPADHGTGSISPNGNPGPGPGPNPTPGPGTTAPFSGHSAQRMTVDQLRRSIPVLFGGITWELRRGTGMVVGFDTLSRTLGEADYLTVTADNREPSPIFEKFMDDMAGNVCGQAIAHDKTVPAGDRRIVVQSDTDIDQNLRFLRLKFHGLYVPTSSMEGIQDLRTLYDGCASDGGSSDAGWTCVCVAVITAPEFQAY